ncbi:hypothetical protein ACFQ2T_08045 [Methylophilus flavus]|uniref:Uncharacterized protein n=1 Tax=Methylophilus flavus TaxID=640084 RepID=A0ABW3PAL8_9PROT
MNKAGLKAFTAFLIIIGFNENLFAHEAYFSAECPITGKVEGQSEAAGLVLGLLAQAVIPVAVDWAAEALAAQGREESKTWTVKGSSNLYKLSSKNGVEYTTRSPSFGCLTIAIPDNSSKTSAKPSEFQSIYKEMVLESKISSFRLPADPLIYIEFGIISTKDNRNFKLVPELLYYKRPTTTSWTKKPRDLSFTFNFNQPGESTPFASTVISFEDLEQGEYRNYKTTPTLGMNGSEWLPLSGLDEADQKVINNYKAKYQEFMSSRTEFLNYEKQYKQLTEIASSTKIIANQKVSPELKEFCKSLKSIKEQSQYCPPEKYLAKKHAFQLLNKLEASSNLETMAIPDENKYPAPPKDLNAPASPFNMSLIITETRDASAFFKHLAVALDKNKKEVSDELVKTLIPSQRKTVKEAQVAEKNKKASDQDAAAVAALAANKNVLDAQIALDNAVNSELSELAIEKFKKDLLMAKINANIAYRAAGLPTIEYSIPAIP